MKPKKTILMYCANEVTRNVLDFQLNLWGYKVTSTSELCLMPAALRSVPADLVLLLPGYENSRWNEFHKTAQQLEFIQIEKHSSIRIFDTQDVLPVSVVPTVHRIPSDPIKSAEFLRHQLKLVLRRKRGPKKARDTQGLAVCA